MNEIAKINQELTPITEETIKQFLCPTASDQDLAYALNICQITGMNPFVRDVDIIKYASDKPAQIVTRKDWFFKVANAHPNYDGMDHGVIVKRGDEIKYQNGAFTAPGDVLLGGWAEVFIKGKRSHRSEVSLKEYDKGHSNWASMKATMINKVSKVQALRECFPEKFQGLIDESEYSSVIANAKREKQFVESKSSLDSESEIIEHEPILEETTNSSMSLGMLKSCQNLDELKKTWGLLSATDKVALESFKEAMKAKLSESKE